MRTAISILTPAQQTVADAIVAALPTNSVLLLRGGRGAGKTAVLRRVHAVLGGGFLETRQVLAGEEAFLRQFEEALVNHDLVIVDDLHLLTNAGSPRAFLLDAAFTAILGEAGTQKKRLLFGLDGDAPWPIRRRAHAFQIG